MKRLFICHPLRSAPEGFGEVCRALCGEIVRATGGGLGGRGDGPEILPLAPQAYFPSFLGVAGSEDLFACRACLELLKLSDAVLVVVYNGQISPGMSAEIEEAARRGIPLIFAGLAPPEELLGDAMGGNARAAADLAALVAEVALPRLRAGLGG